MRGILKKIGESFASLPAEDELKGQMILPESSDLGKINPVATSSLTMHITVRGGKGYDIKDLKQNIVC